MLEESIFTRTHNIYHLSINKFFYHLNAPLNHLKMLMSNTMSLVAGVEKLTE